MYTREQIISEIKRIAELTDGRTISRKDFELYSTIPISTLTYYLGSWPQAVKEADLISGASEDSGLQAAPGSNELLEDLIRLYDETGQVPTPALIDTQGKYERRYYLERWKSISEAYNLARQKQASRTGTAAATVASVPRPVTVADPFELDDDKVGSKPARQFNEKDPYEETDFQMQVTARSIDLSDRQEADPFEITHPGAPVPKNLPSRQPEHKPFSPGLQLDSTRLVPPTAGKTVRRNEPPPPVPPPAPVAPVRPVPPLVPPPVPPPVSSPVPPRSEPSPDSAPVSIPVPTLTAPEMTVRKKRGEIKFIPQTIKPKQERKNNRRSGELLAFRGLHHAPATREGVIYLFGMVADELGYVVKAVMTSFPLGEGRRCLDTRNNRWEQVRFHFEYKSSDMQAADFDPERCDVLICWQHDWEDCPVEVLELKSVISRFPPD